MTHGTCVAMAALLALVLPSAIAAQPPATKGATGQATTSSKDVPFDHLNDDGDRAYERKLSNGEAFNVVISNTCPDVFTYEVRGIVRSSKASAPRGEGLLELQKPLETKTLPVVHDSRYGGYIVSISRTSDDNPCAEAGKLKSRILVISTPLLEWDLSFSGAFTVSSLTNPQYSLQAHPSEANKKQVQEDTGAKDAANLGIAAFVHVYHHKVPWLAGTFGLGIRESNKTEYFLGGGIRFSDKATLDTGVVFGPVTRLPNGIVAGGTATDDNVLADLPTRVARGFFVGISYSFVDVRNKLQQPFAGSPGAGSATSPESAPGESATRSSCAVTLNTTEVTLGGAHGSTAQVQVNAPASCPWQVTGVPAWATVSADSGTGDKALTITAKEANGTGSPRATAEIKIGGKSLKLTQSSEE